MKRDFQYLSFFTLIHLNDDVLSTLSQLERLIGEDIDIEWKLQKGLWNIRIDPVLID